MKIREDDWFFTVDAPVLRIRPCTPAEAAPRAKRWAQSESSGLRRRMIAAAKAGRQTDLADAWSDDQTAEGGQQVPWRELAAGWQRILTSFGSLFEDDEEEELARQAYHRGEMRWRLFFAALNERRRDRTILAGRR